jgi:hypothetical protein
MCGRRLPMNDPTPATPAQAQALARAYAQGYAAGREDEARARAVTYGPAQVYAPSVTNRPHGLGCGCDACELPYGP